MRGHGPEAGSHINQADIGGACAVESGTAMRYVASFFNGTIDQRTEQRSWSEILVRLAEQVVQFKGLIDQKPLLGRPGVKKRFEILKITSFYTAGFRGDGSVHQWVRPVVQSHLHHSHHIEQYT